MKMLLSIIFLLTTVYIYAAEIHDAAAAGDLNKVKTLLEADPSLLESKDGGGNTPLYMACIRQKIEIANFLLDKGADVNAKNNWNQNSLHAANGVMGQDIELIKRLISEGADVNAKGNMGDTPLSWAAARGNLKVAELLLENGSDPNAYNEDFGSILQNTINQGHQEMAKLLIEKGAKLNQKDPSGRTELHLAAIAGFADLVKFLLKKNVDIDAVDNHNRTALYYAAKHGYSSVADILLSAGANKNTIVESNFGPAPQLTDTLKNREAYFWFLGNDGYAVKTQNHLLLFDPPGGINESTDAGLSNGHLNPDELADQKIKLFFSKPQWERYSLNCLELSKHIEDVDYIFSFKPEDKINSENSVPLYHLAKPHESFVTGDVIVHVIPATLGGTAYLVEADGIKIYYGGYHASKDSSQDPSYHKEIDFLKTFGPIDVAILPVAGHLIPSYTYASHQYLVDQLSPQTVYLFHGFYEYDEYLKVKKLLEKGSVTVKYPEGEIAGNRFHYIRQTFSNDYLGQTPPGNSPEVFAPGIVSTPQHQHSAPAFTPDGKEIYWSVIRRSNDSTFQHIMFSEFKNDSWTTPRLAPFSSYKFYEGGPVISSDGKRLLIYRGIPAAPGGDARVINILCYKREGNDWVNPVNLGEGVFHSVTKTGTIYYTSIKNGISRRVYKNNSYSEPEVLNEQINLPGTMNWTPFIAPDESYLLFSRVIEGGDYGNLFITFRDIINDTWTQPIMLNKKINSPSQERFPTLSPDGKYLFFNRWMSDMNDDVLWVNSKVIEEARRTVF